MAAWKVARTGGHRRSSGRSSLMPKSRSSRLFVSCLGSFSTILDVISRKVLLYCVWVAKIQLSVRFQSGYLSTA